VSDTGVKFHAGSRKFGGGKFAETFQSGSGGKFGWNEMRADT